MRRTPQVAVALTLLVASAAARAGDPPAEDTDLNLIPPSTETPPNPYAGARSATDWTPICFVSGTEIA